jgi:uncharacterized protein with HEPN domain
MRPEERDPAYLWDMREAARDVLRFIEGADFERFASDKMLRYAVERQVTVIGEAARRVSQAFKDQHPEIPWRRIIGQRNILVHEYDRVETERVWRVATEHLPRLASFLDSVIPPPPAD